MHRTVRVLAREKDDLKVAVMAAVMVALKGNPKVGNSAARLAVCLVASTVETTVAMMDVHLVDH